MNEDSPKEFGQHKIEKLKGFELIYSDTILSTRSNALDSYTLLDKVYLVLFISKNYKFEVLFYTTFPVQVEQVPFAPKGTRRMDGAKFANYIRQ